VLLSGPFPRGSPVAGETGYRDGGLVVAATSFPLWLFSRNLLAGIPGLRVEPVFAPTRECVHDPVFSQQDMDRLLAADCVVVAGAGSANPLFPRIDLMPQGARIPLVVDASRHNQDGRSPWAPERPSHAVTRDRGAGGPMLRRADRHWWASPLEASRAVDGMAADFLALPVFGLPRNRLLLEENRLRYTAVLDGLARTLRETISGFPNRRIAVWHDAFAYFCRDTGLEVAVSLEMPGDRPAPLDLAAFLARCEKEGVAALFLTPGSTVDASHELLEGFSLPVFALDPLSSGPVNAPIHHYESTMEINLDALAAALLDAPVPASANQEKTSTMVFPADTAAEPPAPVTVESAGRQSQAEPVAKNRFRLFRAAPAEKSRP